MSVLDRLAGRLIVSSQAMDPRSPLGRPETLALLARAAELGGAGGFRVNGADVVRALRPVTKLPIIGIVKDTREGFDNYITTSLEDVEAPCASGVDMVAIQATDGTRPGPDFAALALAAHARNVAVMADIDTLDEARAAREAGADVVATTMVGYTRATAGVERPPFDLVRLLCAQLTCPVIVEGGVWTPEYVSSSFAAGAHAVVSGSSVTAPDLITRRLGEAIPLERH
ncbi:N-acylglucosamine-6-phosphate 2-epimerase [Devosia sp. UYZn731]|uniref:N-acetylmannosamine-6-phosphate 2-epimerase n=1 Tax=Devosia sp. UYZn731 TaxID=3156345 RepID=UPI00339497B9